MTDVMLVNPLDRTHVRRLLGLKAPPLSLMYLASFLRADGFSVSILDDNIEELGPAKVAEEVKKHGSRIVGFTASTSTLSSAFSYIDAVKHLVPETLTILGGPHVSFLPQETLLRCEALDVAVMGEGEETLCELVRKVESNEEFTEVKGIAYRRGNGIKVNLPRELISDLDKLPLPARDIVHFNRYRDPVGKKPLGSMMTSRGCVFGCNFCASSRMMGNRFRYRSPGSIVEEMSELVDRYHVDNIEFIDDNFMLNKKRALAIASEIRNGGIEVSFAASSRVDTMDKAVIEDLRRRGLSTLYLGLESGSQRVLDLMNKGVKLQQGIDAVKLTKESSIRTFGSFIFGYPGETLEEMDQTINYSIKLDLDFAQFSILTPYPGAPIYEDLLRKDLFAVQNYDRFTAMDPIVHYERLGMRSGSVMQKLNMAYLRFYCRPRYLIRHPYMLKLVPKAFVSSLLQSQRDKGQ